MLLLGLCLGLPALGSPSSTISLPQKRQTPLRLLVSWGKKWPSYQSHIGNDQDQLDLNCRMPTIGIVSSSAKVHKVDKRGPEYCH